MVLLDVDMQMGIFKCLAVSLCRTSVDKLICHDISVSVQYHTAEGNGLSYFIWFIVNQGTVMILCYLLLQIVAIILLFKVLKFTLSFSIAVQYANLGDWWSWFHWISLGGQIDGEWEEWGVWLDYFIVSLLVWAHCNHIWRSPHQKETRNLILVWAKKSQLTNGFWQFITSLYRTMWSVTELHKCHITFYFVVP